MSAAKRKPAASSAPAFLAWVKRWTPGDLGMPASDCPPPAEGEDSRIGSDWSNKREGWIAAGRPTKGHPFDAEAFAGWQREVADAKRRDAAARKNTLEGARLADAVADEAAAAGREAPSLRRLAVALHESVEALGWPLAQRALSEARNLIAPAMLEAKDAAARRAPQPEREPRTVEVLLKLPDALDLLDILRGKDAKNGLDLKTIMGRWAAMLTARHDAECKRLELQGANWRPHAQERPSDESARLLMNEMLARELLANDAHGIWKLGPAAPNVPPVR